MKQILILLAISITLFSCIGGQKKKATTEEISIAKDSIYETDHFTFQGVPIDGDAETFVRRMRAKGFTLKESYTTPDMAGKFLDLDCDIDCSVTPKTKQLYEISIKTPSLKSWYKLENEYLKFVRLYTDKYGKRTVEVKDFLGSSSDGDRCKMEALSKFQYYCTSIWELEKGSIRIRITNDQLGDKKGHISFSYEDKVNHNNVEKEELELKTEKRTKEAEKNSEKFNEI